MNSLFLILIVVVAAIGIPWWLKKRKQKQNAQSISTRRDKDEVWKAIKQYLKDTDDYGKEIVDSYVAKRNSIDYINPNLPHKSKMHLKYANKIRTYQIDCAKREAKKNGTTPSFTSPKVRDLYVVCFLTRSIKNKQCDQPRAIECEVVNTKISKKEWDRKILINGALNYDKEMEWIAPIRAAEELKTKKTDELEKQKREKALKRKQAKDKKQQAKIKQKREKQNKKN